MFRGQKDAAYHLEPSLERLLHGEWRSDKVSLYENYSLEQFISKSHLYDLENGEPESTLGWLSLMQHYGVPTRLLDFTTSPYIALYFALEQMNITHATDYSVYCIDYTGIINQSVEYLCAEISDFKLVSGIGDNVIGSRLQESIHDKYLFERNYPIAWVCEPMRLNRRLDLQQGTFLLSASRNDTLESVLSSQIYDGIDLYKFTFTADTYEAAFNLLRKVNITSKSLYGDLSGLAKGLQMLLGVYAKSKSQVDDMGMGDQTNN